MGCDIHLKLEVRQVKPTPIYFEKYDENGNITGKTVHNWNPDGNWYSCMLTRKIWGDRIYGMFAKLANVRGYGISSNIIPIRGFPDNA